MKHLIIDTNVPLKAADMHPNDALDRLCSKKCLKFIKELMESDDIVVLDTEREILKEYQKNINTNSQDNVASQFLMWLYRKISTQNVELHKITKTGDNDYAEFPASQKLKGFDRSDRKFVALAVAHPHHPKIYNGADTDWWDYRDALEENGIHIVFLCEDYMKTKSKRKC